MDTKKNPNYSGQQKIDNDKNRRQDQQQSSPTPGSKPQSSPQRSDFDQNRVEKPLPGRQDDDIKQRTPGQS